MYSYVSLPIYCVGLHIVGVSTRALSQIFDFKRVGGWWQIHQFCLRLIYVWSIFASKPRKWNGAAIECPFRFHVPLLPAFDSHVPTQQHLL